MAFGQEATITPVAIRDIAILLFDPDPAGVENQQATVTVQVGMSDGTVRVREFNLVDHVSAQVIQQLQALAASLRTKAYNEILPD